MRLGRGSREFECKCACMGSILCLRGHGINPLPAVLGSILCRSNKSAARPKWGWRPRGPPNHIKEKLTILIWIRAPTASQTPHPAASEMTTTADPQAAQAGGGDSAGTSPTRTATYAVIMTVAISAIAIIAIVFSQGATEPANPSRSLGDGWSAAPPQVYSSEDEERFKEALKPAAEREWDEIQCVQTEASAACEDGVPDFWLFVYGPYDGMDCESLAILKNIAEWKIEAAEPWRAHCRERPDAPHLPYPTFPAHDSVKEEVVCLSSEEEEILFEDWKTAEEVGFDLSRCSLQERVEPVVNIPSGAERPLCLGHSADTAVFDTLRFTLWDYYWLRGDIQSMWQNGGEDEWRELSESCSAQSRRLTPYTDNCPGRRVWEANWRATFTIGRTYTDKDHLHFHSNDDTMRGLRFTPSLHDDERWTEIVPCPNNNAGNGESGWARPYYETGANDLFYRDIRAWFCTEEPEPWVRFRAAFTGWLEIDGTLRNKSSCAVQDGNAGRLKVIGKGSGTICNFEINLPDPTKRVREGRAERNVCDDPPAGRPT